MRKTVALTLIAAMTAVSLIVILGFGIFAIDTRYAPVKVTTRRSSDRFDLFLGPFLGLGSLDMQASATSYFRTPTGRALLLAGTPL